jgi:hypothetical protein
MALAVFLPGQSLAGTVAVSISGVGTEGNANGVWGWEFDVTQNVSVTALGVYDPSGSGLPVDTQVGLWDENGDVLLGSVTVPVLGTLSGGFRYASVTPFTLNTSDTYRIGFLNIDNDSIIGFSGEGVVWAPEVTYLNEGVYNFNGSLSYPEGTTNSNLPKYFGPDFQFTDVGQVPEPSSFTLLGMGALAILLRPARSALAAAFRPRG